MSLIDTPGVGSYNLGTSIGRGPSYTMRPKTAVRVDSFSPGPAAYDSQYALGRKPPAFSIGARTNIIANNINSNPSPTHYNVEFHSHAIPISLKSRQKIRDVNDVPGPGKDYTMHITTFHRIFTVLSFRLSFLHP
jgi:hypothetical protein